MIQQVTQFFASIIMLLMIGLKCNKLLCSVATFHFFTLLKRSCGAEILTLPGIFRASTSSLTDFKRSFSRPVHALSFINMATAVLDAFPRFPVPGVNFTLNLN